MLENIVAVGKSNGLVVCVCEVTTGQKVVCVCVCVCVCGACVSHWAFLVSCPRGAFDSRSIQSLGLWAGGVVPAAAVAEIMLLILFYREQPSLLCRVQNVLYCELSLNFSNPLCLRNHTDTEGKKQGR